MTWHSKRLEKRLVTASFPAEQAAIAQAQIADIVAWHVAKFTPTLDVQQQMEKVAFDCYVQGLLDGNQIPRVDPSNAAGESYK